MLTRVLIPPKKIVQKVEDSCQIVGSLACARYGVEPSLKIMY